MTTITLVPLTGRTLRTQGNQVKTTTPDIITTGSTNVRTPPTLPTNLNMPQGLSASRNPSPVALIKTTSWRISFARYMASPYVIQPMPPSISSASDNPHLWHQIQHLSQPVRTGLQTPSWLHTLQTWIPTSIPCDNPTAVPSVHNKATLFANAPLLTSTSIQTVLC